MERHLVYPNSDLEEILERIQYLLDVSPLKRRIPLLMFRVAGKRKIFILGKENWHPLRQVGKPWKTLSICPVIADGGDEKNEKERGGRDMGLQVQGVQEAKPILASLPRTVSEF
jgi:hypothetical protein